MQTTIALLGALTLFGAGLIGGGSGIVAGGVMRVEVGGVVVTGSPTPSIEFERVLDDVVADLNSIRLRTPSTGTPSRRDSRQLSASS